MVDPFQERLAARQSSFKEVVVHQSWLQAPRPLPLVIAKFTVDFFLRGVPNITRCRHGREADGDERRLVDADLRSCVHVPTLCRIRGAAWAGGYMFASNEQLTTSDIHAYRPS